MNTLYKDKNGNIYAVSPIQQPKEDWIKLTEEEIEEHLNPPLIEEQRIQQIEAKCNKAIESVYPIYKQINITNLLTPYTEQDREDMKVFIDSKRAICHKAITDGTKVEDINWEVTNG